MISAKVGKISIAITGASIVDPAFIFFGYFTIKGSRCPPSQAVPLPSLNGNALPEWLPYANQGPLSDVKIMIVFSVKPFFSTASIISPTDQSNSIITSP